MKKNLLFEQCLAKVSPEVREEVRLNIDIANRIYDLLKAKKMTQREFAALMGKRESEISRWLTGTHGFTTTTLAKISAVLGEPIVEVYHRPATEYIFLTLDPYFMPSYDLDDVYKVKNQGEYQMAYNKIN
jgi:transcriptional regulator with XRE-family HTH domain